MLTNASANPRKIAKYSKQNVEMPPITLNLKIKTPKKASTLVAGGIHTETNSNIV